MRVDLILQGLHASVQQKAFLVFQFDDDASVVPDLEGNANTQHDARKNRKHYPRITAVKRKDVTREPSAQFESSRFQKHDQSEEGDLPIDLRPRHYFPNPPIEAEVDQWRK